MKSLFGKMSYRCAVSDLEFIKNILKPNKYLVLDIAADAFDRINKINEMKIRREAKNADEELYFKYYNEAIDDVLKLFYGEDYNK